VQQAMNHVPGLWTFGFLKAIQDQLRRFMALGIREGGVEDAKRTQKLLAAGIRFTHFGKIPAAERATVLENLARGLRALGALKPRYCDPAIGTNARLDWNEAAIDERITSFDTRSQEDDSAFACRSCGPHMAKWQREVHQLRKQLKGMRDIHEHALAMMTAARERPAPVYSMPSTVHGSDSFLSIVERILKVISRHAAP
jgi:hypothetical protein